jgi:hypothetical protein
VVGRAHLSVLFSGLLAMLFGGVGLLGHHADFASRFGAVYGVATVLAAFCATLAAVAAATLACPYLLLRGLRRRLAESSLPRRPRWIHSPSASR